jgi:hypothetical protein
MKLEIVWRNPIPPAKGEKRAEPVAVDEFGAVYAVRTANETAAFELILGGSGLGIVARDVARDLGGALWKRQ